MSDECRVTSVDGADVLDDLCWEWGPVSQTLRRADVLTARAWWDMTDMVAVLDTMQSLGVRLVVDLCIVLSLAELGGEAVPYDDVRAKAGMCNDIAMRACLRRMTEPTPAGETAITVSADGATVSITDSGRLISERLNRFRFVAAREGHAEE